MKETVTQAVILSETLIRLEHTNGARAHSHTTTHVPHSWAPRDTVPDTETRLLLDLFDDGGHAGAIAEP
jgi:hypothetical protein